MLHFVKYGERRFLEAFMENGSIQLGTTLSYDEATHGARIGDDSEGLSFTTVTDNNIEEYLETGRSPPSMGGIPLFNHPGCHGNAVQITNVSYNYVIFCMSMCLHRELCLDFSPDYDTALYIDRPFIFLHELSVAFAESGLIPNVRFRHVANIRYQNRNVGIPGLGNDVLEVFLKDEQYANQMEVRAIWSPHEGGAPSEQFYRFNAPKAAESCKLIPLGEMPDYAPDAPQDEKNQQMRRALGLSD